MHWLWCHTSNHPVFMAHYSHTYEEDSISFQCETWEKISNHQSSTTDGQWGTNQRTCSQQWAAITQSLFNTMCCLQTIKIDIVQFRCRPLHCSRHSFAGTLNKPLNNQAAELTTSNVIHSVDMWMAWRAVLLPSFKRSTDESVDTDGNDEVQQTQ